MPLSKGLRSLKKFAEIVDTSSKDASRARKVARSPKMQQEISADRRTAQQQVQFAPERQHDDDD